MAVYLASETVIPTRGAGVSITMDTRVDEMREIPFAPLTTAPLANPLPIMTGTFMMLFKVSSDVLHQSFSLMRSLWNWASLGHHVDTVDQTLLIPVWARAGFPWLSAYIAKFCAAVTPEF